MVANTEQEQSRKAALTASAEARLEATVVGEKNNHLWTASETERNGTLSLVLEGFGKGSKQKGSGRQEWRRTDSCLHALLAAIAVQTLGELPDALLEGKQVRGRIQAGSRATKIVQLRANELKLTVQEDTIA